MLFGVPQVGQPSCLGWHGAGGAAAAAAAARGGLDQAAGAGARSRCVQGGRWLACGGGVGTLADKSVVRCPELKNARSRRFCCGRRPVPGHGTFSGDADLAGAAQCALQYAKAAGRRHSTHAHAAIRDARGDGRRAQALASATPLVCTG